MKLEIDTAQGLIELDGKRISLDLLERARDLLKRYYPPARYSNEAVQWRYDADEWLKDAEVGK